MLSNVNPIGDYTFVSALDYIFNLNPVENVKSYHSLYTFPDFLMSIFISAFLHIFPSSSL